jgi:nicotinamidase-related amidase
LGKVTSNIRRNKVVRSSINKDTWRVDPAKTVCLIIDMQRAFLDEGAPRECPSGRELVPRINQLSAICRKLRIPVIHTRVSHHRDLSDVGIRQEIRPLDINDEMDTIEGTKGCDFYPDMNIAQEDYVISKRRFSALIPGSSHLQSLLHGLKRDAIIICGVATDVCVGTTAMDAMMLDYKVFFVGDLTATFDEERQQVALRVYNKHFAKVITSEELFKELAQISARKQEVGLEKFGFEPATFSDK